ncbi:hypothetical protein [Sphingomonas flavalba]|uniref:hypothetical protein n=1 Tax=Sphingomonas flavalba TaxID=2559804 RepID=UPI00109DF18E|nr:hypothetical protein [Sphingomonas flavalba]
MTKGWVSGAIAAALLTGGCATAPLVPRPQAAPVVRPPAFGLVGLERVMGKPASALVALFGQPDLDVREASARKLQFASAICVLDAYLYPPAAQAEPVVRYIDARQPDGQDIDRASCVAALVRRTGGK